MKEGTSTADASNHVAEADIASDSVPHDEAPPAGPHHFVTGVLKNVRCNTPAIDLNVIVAGRTLGLHSSNYFKIDYTVLDFTLKGNLNPCADLEGRPAKVEYVESASKDQASVVAIEIHR
jgi:hypothetical protein